MNRRVAYVAAVTPVLGAFLLAGLAVTQRPVFNAIVREDSVLEWGEVLAYGAALVVSARVARCTDGIVRVAYALLALAAVGAIGEELSWGQRLFHLTTPDTVAAANDQQELNLHNLGAVGSTTRLVLLVAALYAATFPLFRRPGPFVPPRALVPAFAVVAVYFAGRFAFLPHPTYAQAKFSEWPELCFAAAVALTAYSTSARLSARREQAPQLGSGGSVERFGEVRA